MANNKRLAVQFALDLTLFNKNTQEAGSIYDKMIQTMMSSTKSLEALQMQAGKAKVDMIKETAKAEAEASKLGDKVAADKVAREKKASLETKKAATAAQKEANAEVIKLHQELADLTIRESKAEGDELFRITKDRIDKEIQLEKAKLEFDIASIRKRLSAEAAGSQERLKLQQQIAQKESGSAKKIAGMEGKKAKLDEVPKFANQFRAASEFAENMSTVSQNLVQGNVTGVLTQLGGMTKSLGPFAAVAGTAIDMLKGIGEQVKAVGDRSKKLEMNWVVLNNTLNLPAGGEKFKSLRQELEGLSRAQGQTKEQLIEVAQAVQGFDPENIVSTVDAVNTLAGIEPGTAAKDAAAAIGELVPAGIQATDAMNALGIATRDMGFGAASKIPAIFAKASLSISDNKQALAEAATIYTAFSKTGMGEKAAAAAAGTFDALNATISDPKALAALTTALPKGFDMVGNGLEQGNVSMVKFVAKLQEMGPEGQKVAATVGGTLGEGLQVLLNQFIKTGQGITSFAEPFDNASGAAAKLNAAMTPLQQLKADASFQMWDDAAVKLGQSFNDLGAQSMSMTDKAMSFISGGLGQEILRTFPHLEMLTDMFIDSGLEFEKAKNKAAKFSEVADAFRTVNDEMKLMDNATFLKSLPALMPQIAATSAGAAKEMESLMTLAKAGDTNAISELRNLMTQVTFKSANDELKAMFDTLAAGKEATKDAAESFNFFGQSVLQSVMNVIPGIREMDEAIKGATGESFLQNLNSSAQQQIDSTSAKIDELEAKMQSAAQSGNVEEQGKLADEIDSLYQKKFDLISQEQKMVETVTKNVENQVKMMEKRAKDSGKAFDAEKELEAAMRAQGKILKEHPESMEKVRKKLQDNKQLQIEQGKAALQEVNALTSVVTQLGKKVNLQKATKEEQIKALQGIKAEIQGRITAAKAAIAGLNAIINGNAMEAKTKNQILKIQNEINKAMGVEARGQELSVENAQVQLAAMEAQLKTLEGESAAIDKMSAGMAKGGTGKGVTATGAGKGGGGGKSKADEAREKEIDAAYDALNEEIERQKQLLEDTQKIQEEQRSLERERYEENRRGVEKQKRLADERVKAEEDLIKALSDIDARMTTALKDAADKGSKLITDVTSPFVAEITKQLKSFQAGITEAREKEKSVTDLGMLAEQKEKIEAQLPSAKENLSIKKKQVQEQAILLDLAKKGEKADADALEKAKKRLENTKKEGDAIKKNKGQAAQFSSLMAGLQANADVTTTKVPFADWVKQFKSVEEAMGKIAKNKELLKGIRFDSSDIIQDRIKNLDEDIEKQEKRIAGMEADALKLGTEILIKEGMKELVDPVKFQTDLAEAQGQLNIVLSSFSKVGDAAKKMYETTGKDGVKAVDEYNAALNATWETIRKEGIQVNGIQIKSWEDIANVVKYVESILAKQPSHLEKITKKEAEVSAEVKRLEEMGIARSKTEDATLLKYQAQQKVLRGLLASLRETKGLAQGAITGTRTTITTQASAAERAPTLRLIRQSREALAEIEPEILKLVQANKSWKDSQRSQLEIIRDQKEESRVMWEDYIHKLKEAGGSTDALAQAEKDRHESNKRFTEEEKKELDRIMNQKITKAAETANRISGVFEEAFASIQDIEKSIGEGGVGGVSNIVGKAGDVTTKIGQALLSSSNPKVKMAGAIILGIGLVTKAVAKIISLFKRVEESEFDRAQSETDNLERANRLYEARLKLMQSQIALNEHTRDQAREQFAEEMRLFNLRVESSLRLRAFTQMENDAIRESISLNQMKLVELEKQLAAAEKLKSDDASRIDIGNFLESADVQALGQGARTGGSNKNRLDELITRIKAEILKVNGAIDEGTLALEIQTKVYEYQKKILEEEVALIKFRMKLDGESIDLVTKEANLRKAALVDALNAVGIAVTMADTSEQIRAAMSRFAADENSVISPAIIGMAESWMTADEAMKGYAKTQADLFEKQRELLNLRKELGEITEEEFKAEMLKLLQDRLKFLDAQRKELVKQNAEEDKLLQNTIDRKKIELDIKNLLAEQSGEVSKQQKELSKILKNRQLFIWATRAKGGAPTSGDQSQLDSYTMQAVAKMREMGRSEDEIQDFLKSLPHFQEGGQTTGGPAILHAGEFVLNKETVNSVGAAFLDALNRAKGMIGNFNKLGLGKMDSDRFLANSQMKQKAMQLVNIQNNININQNLNFGNMPASQARSEFGTNQASLISKAVNRGITNGQIDIGGNR